MAGIRLRESRDILPRGMMNKLHSTEDDCLGHRKQNQSDKENRDVWFRSFVEIIIR